MVGNVGARHGFFQEVPRNMRKRRHKRLDCGGHERTGDELSIPCGEKTAIHGQPTTSANRMAALDGVAPNSNVELPAQTLRDLRISLIEAREDERRRIARNLHDDLGQLLLVLKLEATMLKGQCETPAAQRSIESIAARVDETIDAVRRIVDDLHPTALEDLGLNTALEALARRATERLGIEVTVHCDDEDPPVSDRLATALYRCAQEALTNAIRHAQATDIAVELFCDDGQVRLTVQDNGKGLPREGEAPAVTAGGGHGLRGLRERLEAFHGRMWLEDAPGAGARLRVRVPVDGS